MLRQISNRFRVTNRGFHDEKVHDSSFNESYASVSITVTCLPTLRVDLEPVEIARFTFVQADVAYQPVEFDHIEN